MRFLHLSDLHLGRRLNEASLIDDQRDMLQKLLRLTDGEQPDCVLVAGDVYDKSIPSAEAVALLDGFLTELSKRRLPVLLISGNHDSSERLAFGSSLLSAANVHVSPVPSAAEPLLKTVRLHDAFGAVDFRLLPFVKPVHVRALYPDEPIETYTDAIRVMLSHNPVDASVRNVLLCHQFITGSQRSDSEESSVGGLDNVDASVFEGYDYVALGHLHRAQTVGRDSVRYCGTPLKYSFSELKDPKFATFVDLDASGAATVRRLPLTPLHDLRELRGTYDELTLRANYEGTAVDDYLRVILTDEQDVPDALARLQSIYPRLLSLAYDNARTREMQELLPAEQVARQSDMELLGGLYEKQNNRPMTDEQLAYATALMQRIREGRS